MSFVPYSQQQAMLQEEIELILSQDDPEQITRLLLALSQGRIYGRLYVFYTHDITGENRTYFELPEDSERASYKIIGGCAYGAMAQFHHRKAQDNARAMRQQLGCCPTPLEKWCGPYVPGPVCNNALDLIDKIILICLLAVFDEQAAYIRQEAQ